MLVVLKKLIRRKQPRVRVEMSWTVVLNNALILLEIFEETNLYNEWSTYDICDRPICDVGIMWYDHM